MAGAAGRVGRCAVFCAGKVEVRGGSGNWGKFMVGGGSGAVVVGWALRLGIISVPGEAFVVVVVALPVVVLVVLILVGAFEPTVGEIVLFAGFCAATGPFGWFWGAGEGAPLALVPCGRWGWPTEPDGCVVSGAGVCPRPDTRPVGHPKSSQTSLVLLGRLIHSFT